ncbi:hypothetical protein Mgra_00008896 [Meloidogyne graminicola]|uniref:Uncharacterized protein n=1 Tax=Meloidogyne graminicola TaxID=189291 RepID=A0A8S9ZEG3_9BILA|nr:hypothetical protein Mgra_00008896 [Meloidogyne graminicola]
MGTEKSTVEIALRRLDGLTYLGFSKMNDPVNEDEMLSLLSKFNAHQDQEPSPITFRLQEDVNNAVSYH